MTPLVTDLRSEPVIGKYYRVSCITFVRTDEPWQSLPIIGPCHEDLDLTPEAVDHWHYDFRFVTEGEFEWIGTDQDDDRRFGFVAWKKRIKCVPQFRTRKCVRAAGVFPTRIPSGLLHHQVPWMPSLENKYADTTLPACRTCPHRGMPLASMPVKDGVVVCNGHGLAWDVSTGRMVRRLTKDKT